VIEGRRSARQRHWLECHANSIKDNGESWAKAKQHALTAVGRALTTTEKYLEEEFAMRVASFRGKIQGFFQALDD